MREIPNRKLFDRQLDRERLSTNVKTSTDADKYPHNASHADPPHANSQFNATSYPIPLTLHPSFRNAPLDPLTFRTKSMQ